MEVVDRIYELIMQDNSVDTFNNNIDLFQEFYYHNMSIRYGGNKVIKIYEYLLSLNIREDHETMPYINSVIFQDFNNYEMIITQSVYSKDTIVDDNYIEMLYKFIEEYYKFKIYENQSELYKLLDENTFIRDYTGSMMIILNSSFFNISNENIKRLMESIKNNSYLQKIIEDGKMGKRLLDKDYIFQYVSRFLFNAEFVNKENIENDILIKAIKDSKFRDKTILEKIFKDINIYFLFEPFGDKLSPIIDMLEESFDDEFDKISLLNIIYNKMIENEHFDVLLDFILHDSRYIKYIKEDEYENIIKNFGNNYPLRIAEDEVKFMLENDASYLFLINLKSDLKNNNWSDKTRKLVIEATKNIPEYELDFNASIEVLDAIFTKRREVNLLEVVECLKRLMKDYLQKENLNVYIVNNKANGCSFNDENCIQLNIRLIYKLLNETDFENNPESLHILETVFHEARHNEQDMFIKNGMIDNDMYVQYKEGIVSNVCSQYYNKNYVGVSFEKDARIRGAQMVVNLLKQYFPHMEKSINHYAQKVINEESETEEYKNIFELSENISIDEALEKLLSINPSLIQKYDALNREYNINGSKKRK